MKFTFEDGRTIKRLFRECEKNLRGGLDTVAIRFRDGSMSIAADGGAVIATVEGSGDGRLQGLITKNDLATLRKVLDGGPVVVSGGDGRLKVDGVLVPIRAIEKWEDRDTSGRVVADFTCPREAITAVAWAAYDYEDRPHLSCVHVRGVEGRVVTVAVDGVRMAWQVTDSHADLPERGVSIRLTAVRLLSAFPDDDVRIVMEREGIVHVEGRGWHVFAAPPPEFPTYRVYRYMDSVGDAAAKVTLSSKDLYRILKKWIKAFGHGVRWFRFCNMEFGNGTCRLLPDYDYDADPVDFDVTCEGRVPKKVRFNVYSLSEVLDFLGAARKENVTFLFFEDAKGDTYIEPAYIVSDRRPDRFALQMPAR